MLEKCSVKLQCMKEKSLKSKKTRGRFNMGKTNTKGSKEKRKKLDIRNLIL